MITRRALMSALSSRRVAEWVVTERDQERAIEDEARPLQRSDRQSRFTVVVHHDVPRGRGSAKVELASLHGEAGDVVDQAIALAEAAIGPIWHSPPPAAPAKVALLDPRLEKTPLAAAATAFLRKVLRPPGATVTAAIEILRERVSVHASSGFQTGWAATALQASALVAIDGRSLEITREARKLDQVSLGRGLVDASRDLVLLAQAEPPTSGPCALVLHSEALLHGGGLGVWSVFADHASSETERQGLTRYRLRAPVAPGADHIPDPLTITSDGALDFATRSAPVGDDGDAVRRFVVIDRGISAGVGLSMREASRRKTDPNGGVRNLVVKTGSWAGPLPARRTIEVRRLRSLSIDPYTGDASLEVSLGIEHEGGKERVITGGTIRLDLVGALARSQRSLASLQRGPYAGPAAVLIDDVELVA